MQTANSLNAAAIAIMPMATRQRLARVAPINLGIEGRLLRGRMVV